MRGTIAGPALILLAQVIAQIARAHGGSPGVDLAFRTPRQVEACTVVARDTVTLNFLCRTNRGFRQYWITRSTHFVAATPNASFFDLTAGQGVDVTFHNAGRLAIADVVSF